MADSGAGIGATSVETVTVLALELLPVPLVTVVVTVACVVAGAGCDRKFRALDIERSNVFVLTPRQLEMLPSAPNMHF